MDNYLAIVFNTDEQANAGLHKLWTLDSQAVITVHGAGVVHRDATGHVNVATKDTDPGARTMIGAGVGALLGTIARSAGAGAAVGGATGLTADFVKSGEQKEAVYESGFAMKPGQSAVVAEVSEDSTATIDTAMHALGGTIYRRSKRDVRESSFLHDDYADYLYPYDFNPVYVS